MKPKYGELARQAIEHVRDLEEPFRSLTYQKVLEDLIEEAKRSSPVSVTLLPGKEAPTSDAVDRFLGSVVDSTPYVGLLAARGQLAEKSMAVLKMAKDQFGIDGLSPGEIAKVLSLKLRVAGVQAGHVSRDLSKVPEYVQVVEVGGVRKFLLMGGGERRLEEVSSARSTLAFALPRSWCKSWQSTCRTILTSRNGLCCSVAKCLVRSPSCQRTS